MREKERNREIDRERDTERDRERERDREMTLLLSKSHREEGRFSERMI